MLTSCTPYGWIHRQRLGRVERTVDSAVGTRRPIFINELKNFLFQIGGGRIPIGNFFTVFIIGNFWVVSRCTVIAKLPYKTIIRVKYRKVSETVARPNETPRGKPTRYLHII